MFKPLLTTGQTYPSLASRPPTTAAPRVQRGNNLFFFFFMMGDGVNAAAGAERPDNFSEMTVISSPVAAYSVQRSRGSRGNPRDVRPQP